MKHVIRYGGLFIGCLLVAFSIVFLLIPNNLITFGAGGLSILMYYFNKINPAINLLLINFIFILISSIKVKRNTVKKYILPSILIPVCVYILIPLTKYWSLSLPELVLTILVSGYISGLGYSLIYKQGFSAGTTILLEEFVGKLTRFHSRIYSWIIDVVLLIIMTIFFDYKVALYSLIVMIISKYMLTKVRFGINDSKMFYIITSKEDEVKNYIIHDLKGELSILDSKGGYSNKKNRIILCVFPSSDYFKLKSGLKVIDPDAFIAITDTYDVVNRKNF